MTNQNMDHKLQIFLNDNKIIQSDSSNLITTTSYSSSMNEEVDISFTKNFVKRSISQNPQMNINRGIIRRRKKRETYRRTKSHGDTPCAISGFWNWQLEIGSWKEIEVEILKKKRKKRRENPNNQRNMIEKRRKSNPNMERFTLNFFKASSATEKDTNGKKHLH